MGNKYGVIIVNAYRRPEESVLQAERLQNEFLCSGVRTEIVSDGYLRSGVFGGEISSPFSGADFIVYLDKDKYLSAELDKLSVRLFNSHNAVRLCDDKAETIIALSGKGLNIPDTVFGALSYSDCDNADELSLKAVSEKLGFPLVVKESFGSMGKGVYLARDFSELKEIFFKVNNKPHLFQRYLPYAFGTDIRVIVIGGKVIGAIKRVNENDFRSNVALGGVAEKFDLPKDYKAAAIKAASVLGLDYCGVDLLIGEGGKPYICEVNSNAFFFGFEKATGLNVAKLYAEYIIKTVYGK